MAKKKPKKKDVDINIKVNNLDKVMKKGKMKCNTGTKCGGFAYFLGFLGAVIYYTSTASGFWIGVLGFLKAVVWPVFLVFELLKFLGA